VRWSPDRASRGPEPRCETETKGGDNLMAKKKATKKKKKK